MFLWGVAGLWLLAGQIQAAGPEDLYSVPPPVPIGGVDVRLASEIVDAKVEEVDGRTFAIVEGQYFVENTDLLETQVLTVSFPTSLPGGMSFSPSALQDFTFQVDGQIRRYGIRAR